MKNWCNWLNNKEYDKPEEILKEEPIGSFLFAIESNPLAIVSVERCRCENTKGCIGYTEVVFKLFKSLDNQSEIYSTGGGTTRGTGWRYYISSEQHEDFIKKLSAEIQCIVVPGVIK